MLGAQMSRKALDLELLNQQLEEKEANPYDRNVRRQMQIVNAMSSVSEEFVVTEEDEDEVVVIHNGTELPSDDELEHMKQDLAEQDRIEKERWLNGLPWWKRPFAKLGIIKYARR
jgi:hypothetical protein